jgi:metallo-beta-lactamase class B
VWPRRLRCFPCYRLGPTSRSDAHIATAKAAAGQDYRATLVNLCLPSAPPFKVFDNLYWLGTRQHSSWALQTSGGIIIIDTNFAWATEPEIIEGLTKLGLNPRDIKYVIISHAHGDHDQGAAELQKRFGAQVV